jgi:ABC-type uncharacterized transport system auxiliary subunit
MRFVHTAAAIALLIVLSAGCGSVPTTEYYDVRCAFEPVQDTAEPLEASVMVRPFSTVETYAQPPIAYRSGPYRLYYDRYREWAAAPGPLVWGEFTRCLRRSGLFQTVIHSGFPSRTDYQIFGRVLEFYELDEGDQRFAVLALELTVTDADERPIFCVSPRAKVAAPPAEDLSGVAGAMSQALERSFVDFLRAARKHLPPDEKAQE